MKVKLNATLKTNGKGLWSDRIAEVQVTGAKIDLDNHELRVYFKNWKVDRHGLIYTDPRFLKEVRDLMENFGLPRLGIEYSEQGMQGGSFVSFRARENFIQKWFRQMSN